MTMMNKLCACGCEKLVNKLSSTYLPGHNGFHLTEEQEMKRHEGVSRAMKGKPCSENRRQKLLNYFKNPESRRKVSETQLRLHRECPERFDSFRSANEKRRNGLIPSGRKGKTWNKEHKIKMSERSKKNWSDPDYAKRVLGRRSISGPEKFFQTEYIDEHQLPYFFNGNVSNDNKIIIDRKIPDFVHNTENKLIEIWGDYFHKGQNPQDRINFFKERKYDCLVLWASELKRKEMIMNKILIFERGDGI